MAKTKAKAQPKAAAWRSRIDGYGEEAGDQLLSNEANWRIHPRNQQDALSAIFRDVGVVQNIIVNKRSGPEWPDGQRGVETVVDGHLRASLAISAGEKLPITYVDLSPDEEATVLATLDPLSAMASADKAQLDALLKSVQTEDAAITQMLADLAKQSGLDYGSNTGEDPGPQIDRAEELRSKWQTALGQLWEIPSKTVLGKAHRLSCGDSTKAEDVVRLMGRERAALVFTDPPYGVGYDGGTKVREKLAGDASTDLYVPACAVAARFSDEKAALYLWHAGIKGIAAAAAAAAAAAGYEIRCELVWNKNQAQYGALSAQYKQKHEPCYYCFKRGSAPRWYGPTNEVTVWDCDRAPVNEFHPTQKPPELAQRAMRNSSEAGHVVFDPFLGSGTTMVAAEQLGRVCYGCDISAPYVAVSLQRMADMGLEPRLVDPT